MHLNGSVYYPSVLLEFGAFQHCPSLEDFKAKLDGALSSLVDWKISLPRDGGLELDVL